MPVNLSREKISRTNEAHFVVQGKGGVGKSTIATLLAEYLRPRIVGLRCFDTDPVNPTFSSYKSFDVQRIELFDEESRLVQKAFDGFMVPLLEPGTSALIDNGATTFIPLMNYIQSTGVFEMLVGEGKKVFVHVVLAGGDAAETTVDGFVQIAKNIPEGVSIIVWLNELHGPVTVEGVPFTDLGAYKKVKERIAGILTLPAPANDMFAEDFQKLRQARISFEEASSSPNFTVMERQRIKMMWRKFAALMSQCL